MQAWVIVKPFQLMIELEKALKRLGISQQFFTFKVMTPIYPDDVQKLKNLDYYETLDMPYEFKSARKAELKRIAGLEPILYEFQIKANFDKEEMIKNLGKNVELETFEKNYKHVQDFSFRDNNFDPDMEIDAKLWTRELFLNAQFNCA